ncbi:hypothetical protein [Rhodohalobacter mucosus]|uniref:WD40 repeat domain-containing protein n=1 Tax=Rhodohalobacter mucosus TaxID=2079485 RepID=A0A316TT92_9BACT|nr:hypothetical protein [Rhodohalobacter mucosus]PWN06185.1 hypothetical protein DDZ15_10135 [Rhodohalobacter mucosus]
MKHLLVFAVLSLSIQSVIAQSVTVSIADGQAGRTDDQVVLKSGVAEVTGSDLSVKGNRVTNTMSWSVSPGGNKIGAMTRNGMVAYRMLDYYGNSVANTELEFFNSSDESIAVYQFDDGRAVARDNIANFTFFDADGSVVYSISNSSQSSGGEQISRLAADPEGKTIVLYNPVISYDSRTGSRAQIVYGQGDVTEFFRSDSREIKQVRVADDGLFITVLTSGQASDRVHVYDRFGNEIHTMDLEPERLGVTLSGRGEFLTAYGAGRVQVFNIITGERVGSSSSRTAILYGEYIPEDETILVFGGNASGSSVADATVIAVHVGRRQIARTNLDRTAVMREKDYLSIVRTSTGTYRMKGLNQELEIRTSF